jgi:hypothetical protein
MVHGPHSEEALDQERVKFANVCGHLGAFDLYALFNIFRKHMDRKTSLHLLAGEPACYSDPGDLISCQHCPTEVCIDIIYYPDRIALVVTKWMSVGPGFSRDDGAWSSRLKRAEEEQLEIGRGLSETLARSNSWAYVRDFRDLIFGWANEMVEYSEGSIRAVFGSDDTDVKLRLTLNPQQEREMPAVVFR